MSNWWQRLNEKPPGWDEPKNRISRWLVAIAMGMGLLWVRQQAQKPEPPHQDHVTSTGVHWHVD